MSRRLNFTHRQRIKQEEAAVQIVPSTKRLTVDVTLDLSRLLKAGLSASYPVFVEAYHEPKSERFDLGTAGTISGAKRWEIPTFGPDEPVLFRLKVVDNDSSKGRLAAFCQQIRPRPPGEAETESLLDINVGPLDGEVFRIDLPSTPSQKPVLVLNEAVDAALTGGIKQFALTPMFIALVFPQAIRQVLTHWLRPGADEGDEEDEQQPRRQWLRFAQNTAGVEPPKPDEEDETAAWIDLVVASFAKRIQVEERFTKSAEAA